MKDSTVSILVVFWTGVQSCSCGAFFLFFTSSACWVAPLLRAGQTDLEHTLGEAAGLGAAGVVLWGELRFAKSKRRCEKLRDYVSSVLGIYVRTLKSGVQHCSQHLCNDNGRCARRDPHSSHMMHCSGPDPPSIPDAWNITCDHTDLISAFRCLCYQGWTGERCQERMP